MGTTTQAEYFKEYYETNRETISKRRKALYEQNPDRREKAIAYQREYRSKTARPSTKGMPQFRLINGKPREVVRVSGAAAIAGCSIEFIRKYEAAGVIPKPLVQSVQRYYTERQVGLIKDFFEVMRDIKYNRDEALRPMALQEQKQVMSTNWKKE